MSRVLTDLKHNIINSQDITWLAAPAGVPPFREGEGKVLDLLLHADSPPGDSDSGEV